MPKPLQVILEPADLPNPDGSQSYFVLIVNVPFVRGEQKALVITDARPLDVAERIKARVEQALHDYRKPQGKRSRKPKTAWARLLRDG